MRVTYLCYNVINLKGSGLSISWSYTCLAHYRASVPVILNFARAKTLRPVTGVKCRVLKTKTPHKWPRVTHALKVSKLKVGLTVNGTVIGFA